MSETGWRVACRPPRSPRKLAVSEGKPCPLWGPYRKPKRLVVEGNWKMPSSQVRPFGKAKKINPIEREKDNTSDLELAEMKARAKFAHIKQGDNLNPANNGKTTTAPHGGTT
ncbi:hypothetical protein HWB51_gp068 [Mycobacterium phage Cuke]|uniref:Uncharacterized protein n=1 Tax=Mycobacterium phage Cuke TaxID=2079417 RepID=A0A2L1IX37_9CAUD|nr:hypothetical protein HWB51_gp068 [Mycobacterium phage Cuke]AVD99744.1 hypothetical protein SEA_CUKE_128 [Mycobacterium phage Cuke]